MGLGVGIRRRSAYLGVSTCEASSVICKRGIQRIASLQNFASKEGRFTPAGPNKLSDGLSRRGTALLYWQILYVQILLPSQR